jgi:hypothetical protein
MMPTNTRAYRVPHSKVHQEGYRLILALMPFQVPSRTQYAKIRQEGADNWEIGWPLKEMPQFRRDVQQAPVCHESMDYSQRGALSRGKRHTQCCTHQTTQGLSNDVFVE